jgi:hypothetical protein
MTKDLATFNYRLATVGQIHVSFRSDTFRCGQIQFFQLPV